ncbi:DUF4825 domain-containing protein [Paenibacillus senegalensis]|uniref:DUF4825 domain-containing protein n=1 Tax=Paenibacillus senegalensis TaxID=1465766 RepID=UPI0012FAF568|nr:DUF4825 domain-containing protein [Paenibacillus senegalensis]
MKNKWIIALLVTGLILFLTIQGAVKPYLNKQELVYEEQQQSPLTHDFSKLLAFQHPYMGNASNLSNLNNRLPLFRDLSFTFQLYPDDLHAQLIFTEPAAFLDSSSRGQAFMYNVTANFVLIDNLQRLTLQFPDQEYTFVRDKVAEWYGEADLSTLRDEDLWDNRVRNGLHNADVVEHFMEQTAVIQTKSALAPSTLSASLY